MLTLSAGSRFSSHNLANEIGLRWLDLGKKKNNVQRFTVMDETREDFLREKDLKRLSRVSSLIAFPTEASEFRTALAAQCRTIVSCRSKS